MKFSLSENQFSNQT